MASSAQDPLGLIGTLIHDKYKVEAFVAEGGFSVLYRAQHQVWQQPVALKFLKVLSDAPPEQRDLLLKGFVQEGALLRELSSRAASILQAHDVGTWTAPSGEWFPYLVLEWLEGAPLDSILAREKNKGLPPWTLEQVIHLLDPAMRALEIVHRKGVAHRDIKPGNLFVLGDPRGPDAFLKVLDFGIAKVIGDAAQLSAAQAKTGTGFSSFTPWYGAPEQFTRSVGATGPWTDVFALALVVLEMLTQQPPLDGEEIAQLAFSSTDPLNRPTPRQRGVSVSDAVEEVFLKAVAIKTTDRYPTAGEFWSALRVAAGEAPMPMSRLSREIPASAFGTSPNGSTQTSSRDPRSGGGTSDFGAQPTAIAPTPLSVASGTTGVGQPPAPARSPTGKIAGAVVLTGLIAIAAFVGLQKLKTPATTTNVASGAASTQAAPPPSASTASSATAVSMCPADMVAIPGGNFFMGYDGEGAQDFEKPVHKINLSPYCMDITEVTVEAYRACSDKGDCARAPTTVQWPGMKASEKKIYGPLCNIDDAGRDRHPINCVDWDMATTYCKAQGKRLPTSAEWELAVRSPDGRIYPWGDDPPDANHLNACGSECVAWGRKNGDTTIRAGMHKEDDSFATTAPVGSFPKGRSKYGLDDVIGNVMEWVQDWDGPYEKIEPAPMNPTGPSKGTERVIRGGGWNAESLLWVRPSFRYSFAPEARSHAIGFRCAK